MQKVCKSDVQFTAWQDKQIHQENEAIAQRDKQVHDYVDTGRTSKAPDKIGPLFTYMEECGVFKPLDTIVNPLGLCRFYWTDLKKSNDIMGLKSMASARKIHCLLVLAKELKQLLTIVVFEGGTVTPLGLLQELHSRLALSCIAISTPDEVKVGPKNRMSCCPICAYAVKNGYSFLNHIIIGHYWSSFSCGKCLEFAASSGQQVKKHFPDCKDPTEEPKKKCSKCKASKVQSGDKSDHKSKRSKKDKAEKEDTRDAKEKKLCRSPSKSGGTTASLEQASGSACHSRCIAESNSPQKKSKKCAKK